MQTIYVSKGKYRLEYAPDLCHPFQLVGDWRSVMDSEELSRETVKFIQAKPRVRASDTTRIMVRR